jgi:hypothetical protein
MTGWSSISEDFHWDNGTIVCNVGGGNAARSVYRIVSYAHHHSSIRAFKKELLHSLEEQQAGKGH